MMDDHASQSDKPSRKLSVVLATVAIISAAALVLGVVTTWTSDARLVLERAAPIPSPDGAPDGEAYVLLTDWNISPDDRVAIAADLGSSVDIVSPESVKPLASATSEFGATQVMTWEEEPKPDADGDSLSVCQGTQSSHSWQQGGAGYCFAEVYELTAPLVLKGTSSTPDISLAQVTIFDAPPEAKWMIATTELGDLIVANVLHNASYVEWLTSEYGALRNISLLDDSLAEVWFKDDFTGPPPVALLEEHGD